MSAEDDRKWKPAEDISGESRATIKFPTVADKARLYKLLENGGGPQKLDNVLSYKSDQIYRRI